MLPFSKQHADAFEIGKTERPSNVRYGSRVGTYLIESLTGEPLKPEDYREAFFWLMRDQTINMRSVARRLRFAADIQEVREEEEAT